MRISNDGSLGIGTTSPQSGGHLTVLDTGEQLRLSYDADNYVSFTVDSNGDLTIDGTGDDVTISDDVTMTNASSTLQTISDTLYVDEIQDITGTTTIQDAFEITDGTYGCYWVFGATTTMKCY